jgi:hypothetical protein
MRGTGPVLWFLAGLVDPLSSSDRAFIRFPLTSRSAYQIVI